MDNYIPLSSVVVDKKNLPEAVESFWNAIPIVNR